MKFTFEKILLTSLFPPLTGGSHWLLLVALLFGPDKDSHVSMDWGRQTGHSSKGLTFHMITQEHIVPIFIPFASLGIKKTCMVILRKCKTTPLHYKSNMNTAVLKHSQCKWQHVLVSSFWEPKAAARWSGRTLSVVYLAMQQPLIILLLKH